MQKLLSTCGLLALLGFAALPARANVFPDPFTPVQIPQVVRPLPLGTPLFNIARPFVVTQFRWQIVTVPMAGQPAPFVFLVDTLSGTSFLLRVDPRQPAGYSWQLLDFD
ncbi:MAG: hypothetical protein ACYDCO_27630 [Armatimonadota bacterium]